MFLDFVDFHRAFGGVMLLWGCLAKTVRQVAFRWRFRLGARAASVVCGADLARMRSGPDETSTLFPTH